MDPRENPYAPGAGSPPPELAGRDPVLREIAVSLDRIKAGLVPEGGFQRPAAETGTHPAQDRRAGPPFGAVATNGKGIGVLV